MCADDVCIIDVYVVRVVLRHSTKSVGRMSQLRLCTATHIHQHTIHAHMRLHHHHRRPTISPYIHITTMSTCTLSQTCVCMHIPSTAVIYERGVALCDAENSRCITCSPRHNTVNRPIRSVMCSMLTGTNALRCRLCALCECGGRTRRHRCRYINTHIHRHHTHTHTT